MLTHTQTVSNIKKGEKTTYFSLSFTISPKSCISVYFLATLLNILLNFIEIDVV